MYIPLQLRLTLFYTLVLALALWFFGQMVYTQAAQRAYRDLDTTLSSRAASVRLGKDLFIANPPSLPLLLPSVDSVGTQGVSIEILDDRLTLLATTSGSSTGGPQTSVGDNSTSPTPWDAKAAHTALEHADSQSGIYSTVAYQGQHVRVYTLLNNDLGQSHVIQAARSEQDIEQSLTDLRLLLIRGGALVVVLALVGGWFISWGVLSAVHRMTRTAQNISTSGDFHQRVPERSWFGRDELTTLAAAFNQMLANLEALYQQQQRFVADASHELRAPITSIRCNLDLLAKAPDLPAEEAQAALADAQAEANRMGRLVGDLLTLARSDSARQSQQSQDVTIANGYKKNGEEKQLVDLDSLLLEVFRQYHPALENGNIELRQQGPGLLLQHITPARVHGDADQLKQVLVALLDNALKYTPYEGSISLSLTTDEHFAIVKVSDTGIGISPDDLPHIFERFYRADRARSRNRGGSGLGLAIVQSIVLEYQGTIEAESAPGKGSTFTMRLPLPT
ncbi:MAG: HAMP domain-containing histidine kinase [Chloroflexi bacterium]|nr:MAG: HAMP domain-containing histidine kinase [Chloroflexota bacterium]